MILRQGVPVKSMVSIRCRIAAPQHRAISTYEDLFFIYIYLYIIIITYWRACYSVKTVIWRVKRTPKQSIRTLFRGTPQSFYPPGASAPKNRVICTVPPCALYSRQHREPAYEGTLCCPPKGSWRVRAACSPCGTAWQAHPRQHGPRQRRH